VSLVSDKEYQRARPRLSRHEIHLVLIDKNTILTVRKPQQPNEPAVRTTHRHIRHP
jgi:hypothetical protein